MILKIIALILFVRYIDINHVIYAIHRNVACFVLGNNVIAGVVVKMPRWSFTDYNDLRIKLLEPRVWNLTGCSTVMRGEYDGCFFQFDVIYNALHEVSLEIT